MSRGRLAQKIDLRFRWEALEGLSNGLEPAGPVSCGAAAVVEELDCEELRLVAPPIGVSVDDVVEGASVSLAVGVPVLDFPVVATVVATVVPLLVA